MSHLDRQRRDSLLHLLLSGAIGSAILSLHRRGFRHYRLSNAIRHVDSPCNVGGVGHEEQVSGRRTKRSVGGDAVREWGSRAHAVRAANSMDGTNAHRSGIICPRGEHTSHGANPVGAGPSL